MKRSRSLLWIIFAINWISKNTKIRQAKKWKSFEAFGRMWQQDSYHRKLKSCTDIIKFFFLSLDKCSERAEQATNKRWKRMMTRSGHPVEKEPPVNTPKWALSDEWRDELHR